MKKLIIVVTACVLAVLAMNTAVFARQKEYSEYYTFFNANDKPRRVNITQAAKSIDGAVVYPGDEFSFNNTVGPTIERRGYMAGRIFINGKDAIGVGGGVCQVSSTLYCAVINMGLKTTERHPHSKPVKYVNKGFDAATSYGVIDYKFVNNKSFPVIIRAAVEGNKLIVRIEQK